MGKLKHALPAGEVPYEKSFGDRAADASAHWWFVAVEKSPSRMADLRHPGTVLAVHPDRLGLAPPDRSSGIAKAWNLRFHGRGNRSDRAHLRRRVDCLAGQAARHAFQRARARRLRRAV